MGWLSAVLIVVDGADTGAAAVIGIVDLVVVDTVVVPDVAATMRTRPVVLVDWVDCGPARNIGSF